MQTDERTMLDVAERVAKKYARRCRRWGDLDDMQQEAFMAIYKASPAFESAVGVPFEGYAWQIGSYAIQTWLFRDSSPVSGTSDPNKLVAQHSVELHDMLASPCPAQDDALDQLHWCDKVKRRIKRVLRKKVPRGHWLALPVLLYGEKSVDVARRHRVPVNRVYNAASRARDAIMCDPQLWRIWVEEL